MADNAEDIQTDEEKKPRKLVSLVLWSLIAVVSIGAGFATPFVTDKLRDSGEEKESPDVSDTEPPALIEFGEVTVNLNESRLNRYLRLNISLLVGTSQQEAVTKSMEENQAILKSWLLSYLADKAMEDIRGATGQNRLRREILLHFNSVMFPGGPPLIRNVLFQEFNVQ